MDIKKRLLIFERPIIRHSTIAVAVLLMFSIIGFFVYNYLQTSDFRTAQSELSTKLETTTKELEELKSQDQVKINRELNAEVKKINDGYKQAATTYEELQDLKVANTKLDKKYDTQYALSLKQLADRDYDSATKTLAELNKGLDAERAKLQPATTGPTAATSSNTPPGSGFSRQSVTTDRGSFTVDIIAADLNSTRVIVDTASDSDCRDNCPVMALGDYVSRSGAFAGINGPFFCPASYPSCAGKTNSFDTLLMNKNKKYFNSDNNVYSTVPAVIFSGNSARFVGQSLEWGRDTSVDSVIANHPLYVLNGQNLFGGSGDPKIDSKGSRTFVGATGSTAYIGIVYGASGADAAAALKVLGMQNALGMDQGGSTALWFGGYKAGPGRGIPSAVLFVRK